MATSGIGPIAVFVSPPDRDRYDRFSDYLQDVVHFHDFLERHQWAVNAQTKNDASSRDKLALRRKFVDKPVMAVDTSSDESDAFTPATTVVNQQFQEPLPSREPKVQPKIASLTASQADKMLAKQGLLTKEERMALASVDGVSGSVQVGKKATKARLKKYCSDNLVEELVEKNRISRVEEHLNAVEKQMAVAHRNAGRKLIKSDLRKPEKLETKPDPHPGRASYVDYAALWESSESSQSS